MSLLRIFVFISMLSIVYPFIMGIIKYKSMELNVKLIFLLIVLGVITEALMHIKVLNANIELRQNIHIANVYSISEVILTSIYYFLCLRTRLWKSIALTSSLFISFQIFTHILFDNQFRECDLALSIHSVFMILFSLKWFYSRIVNDETQNLVQNPLFWINTAFVVYYGGNLFLTASNNYLIDNHFHFYHNFRAILFSGLNILLNIFIGIAFWKSRRYSLSSI